MGEELGNYVHQNSIPRSSFGTHRQTVTLLSTPTLPRSSFGTQTDRQTERERERETVYMGEELGNYVHQNSLYGGGAR